MGNYVVIKFIGSERANKGERKMIVRSGFVEVSKTRRSLHEGEVPVKVVVSNILEGSPSPCKLT